MKNNLCRQPMPNPLLLPVHATNSLLLMQAPREGSNSICYRAFLSLLQRFSPKVTEKFKRKRRKGREKKRKERLGEHTQTPLTK